MTVTGTPTPWTRLRASIATIALLTSTGLVATSALGDPSAPADIVVSGDQLTGSGATWFPPIPASSWLPFEAIAPGDTVYVDSATPVTAVGAYVIDPAATGITLPKGRTPSVFFALTGDETEISEPFTITWPNLWAFPAGEAHLVFAYDPRVDRWNVCGAAVVSADGTVLEQFDASGNVTLSYYFVDENVVVTEPLN